MLVRYRMSPQLITATRGLPITEARTLLNKHRIRHLPVVQSHQLIGIVTDRDLRSAPASARTVDDVMTVKPVVIIPDAPVDEAARVLRAHKIGALPVVEGKRLVGILTETDVLDAFVDLSGVTEPTYHLTLTEVDVPDPERRVREIVLGERGQLKWLHRNGRRRRLYLRLKVKRVDDVVTQLEAAGFEVNAVVSSTRK